MAIGARVVVAASSMARRMGWVVERWIEWIKGIGERFGILLAGISQESTQSVSRCYYYPRCCYILMGCAASLLSHAVCLFTWLARTLALTCMCSSLYFIADFWTVWEPVWRLPSTRNDWFPRLVSSQSMVLLPPSNLQPLSLHLHRSLVTWLWVLIQGELYSYYILEYILNNVLDLLMLCYAHCIVVWI